MENRIVTFSEEDRIRHGANFDYIHTDKKNDRIVIVNEGLKKKVYMYFDDFKKHFKEN